jgi:ATP-dependent 26S proteasome regulatory subunit
MFRILIPGDSSLLLLQQIQELVEAIVLPMTHKERFQKLGIRPPKGVLLYGPPGTGKTLMARACAAQTNATFLKLAGPQLVQVGDMMLCCLFLHSYG